MQFITRLSSLLSAMLLLAACGASQSPLEAFPEEIYSPQYATGFQIRGAADRTSTLITLSNPWQGAEQVQTHLLILRDGEQAPKGFTGQTLQGEAKRIVCMSSTHIALLDAIGEVERVVGVSGINFVSNPYVAQNKDRLGDVGYDGHIDFELLLSLKPDIVLLYGIAGACTMEPKLQELGIPYLYIGEYLEEIPLGKTEWMLVLAELAGCREKAEPIFAAIPKRYQALQERVAQSNRPRPKVMINTPYGDSWFMASATSYVARLIADAGGDYLYQENHTNQSLPIDLEEAMLLASEADVWINVGNASSMAMLKRDLPKFAHVPCVVQGNVWNCNRRMNPSGGNDYWESGVVHPDLVLQDLVTIFHPELLPDSELTYYRQLQ